MKKIFWINLTLLFSVFFLVTGCAKKEISSNDNAVTQEETIEPNIAEPQDQMEEESKIQSGTIISSIYFDFDKYEIRSDMQSKIDEVVSLIQKNLDMDVLIEGNTDEFGSDEYNFALGNKRALVLKTALITRGVRKDRIQVVSLGKSKPICTEKTNECYQKNRRGDIRLVIKP